jgi:hypothetical protein
MKDENTGAISAKPVATVAAARCLQRVARVSLANTTTPRSSRAGFVIRACLNRRAILASPSIEKSSLRVGTRAKRATESAISCKRGCPGGQSMMISS